MNVDPLLCGYNFCMRNLYICIPFVDRLLDWTSGVFDETGRVRSVHYSCDVLAAEAAERAKEEQETLRRKNKSKVTWDDGAAGEGDMRKERRITKGAIMFGKMKEAGRESLDAKLGYGLREGPPVKVGIDFAKRRVPKAL
ncbi:hypothetical protein FOZ62_032127, partial [Perkinsus olseni]